MSKADTMAADEYGKQCQRCRKRRLSRRYYRMINGVYPRLCVVCWEEQERLRERATA